MLFAPKSLQLPEHKEGLFIGSDIFLLVNWNLLYPYKSTSDLTRFHLNYRCNNKGKVKIGKKSRITTKCSHEVLVSVFKGETQTGLQNPGNTIMVNCRHCKKEFDSDTGGRCQDCSSGVFYCSKQCQVSLSSDVLLYLLDLNCNSSHPASGDFVTTKYSFYLIPN